MDNTFVIITSIYPPTKAVFEFSKLEGMQTIVVGDKKTSRDWFCEKIDFLSTSEQLNLFPQFAGQVPYNHYSRKMLGYLYAIKRGANYIIDSDDDNIPQDNFSFPAVQGDFDVVSSEVGYYNVYSYFTDQRIWPRGFPLQLINNEKTKVRQGNSHKTEALKVGIWQALADGDPDVDAIYRLTDNTPCIFYKKSPIVLDFGTICPINSQCTAFSKEVFPLLYLPCTVSFRFTDILRGIVAQPILWANGLHVGFTSSLVFQERNIHDYMKDFDDEVIMYREVEKVTQIIKGIVSTSCSIKDNLYNVYQALAKHGIVQENEVKILTSWLTFF
ncbi:STELLO glycosyltransferase family protein [Sporomusa sphaeroides DSM 2875]|uniref:STELLO glycosyltransferase family protein n=1 Tax=Sporomusa sphaeroides TaxID=47679 RepID=UPI00202F27FC|nr:STELLO glycosyltransferase family protein [Sporomusa sphaeroides]MCM0758031.1 STELLO glycosyltransferase family protein [Sporomusa sphaeroides DSM 2875]